jgi:uroporphyrin-3 C-methyltransferase
MWVAAGALLVLSVASAVLAYQAQHRVATLERELVRRQQDSQEQSTEARAVARQAQDMSRDAGAKVALVEAKLAEVALQRSQLDELMQSLSRSRDENLVADIDAGLRVAVQQAAITGSAEPIVAALKTADERLQRTNQPRLERVRRAIAHDLEKVKSVAVADISSLVIKLDEAARLVDDLPLLSSVTPPRPAPAVAAAPAKPASGLVAATAGWWQDAVARVWSEVRSLVRVTRIDQPEAMLIEPNQAFFLRENLKLRLLNARLALLSRQFDTVQSDLRSAQQSLDKYFDRNARRTALAGELLRQVSAQAQQSGAPRPDDTLAALAAVAAGR